MLIKMYENPFTPGYEVLSKSGYSVDSHGSLSSTATYLITNDVPNYVAMSVGYIQTEHEIRSSIKYGNFDQDYSNLREIQESLNGPPIEFYIPNSFVVEDGSGRNDERQIVHLKPKLIDKVRKEALSEIAKAQQDVTGRKIRKIEFEDVLLLRKIKRTIVFEDEKQDI